MAPEISDVAAGTIIASNWGNLIRDRVIQRYATAAERGTESPTPGEGDLSYLEDSNTLWVYDGAAWVEIFAGTVETGDIANDAVTQPKIGPGAVDTTELAADAVTNPKIAAAAVDTSELADAAVGVAKIALGAVNGDRLDGDVVAAFEVDNATEVASAALTGSFAPVASVTLSIPAGWGSWKCEAWASYVSRETGDANLINVQTVIRIDGSDQQVKEILIPSSQDRDQAIGGRRTGLTTTGSRTMALRARISSGTGSGSIDDIYLYARAVRTS